MVHSLWLWFTFRMDQITVARKKEKLCRYIANGWHIIWKCVWYVRHIPVFFQRTRLGLSLNNTNLQLNRWNAFAIKLIEIHLICDSLSMVLLWLCFKVTNASSDCITHDIWYTYGEEMLCFIFMSTKCTIGISII